jgi:hypothetical protein
VGVQRYGGPVDYRLLTTGAEDRDRLARRRPGALALEVGQLAYFTDTEGNVFGALQPVSR